MQGKSWFYKGFWHAENFGFAQHEGSSLASQFPSLCCLVDCIVQQQVKRSCIDRLLNVDIGLFCD